MRDREKGRDIDTERTLGSGPEPKADTQPLSHPGVPNQLVFLVPVAMCFVALYTVNIKLFMQIK